MSDVVLFVSVSVDGFSAGPSDDLTRLHRWLEDETDADREGIDELTRDFRSAGAIVFGRRTYDAGQVPWGDEEVFHAPVFVATHEPLPPATKNGTTFTFVNGQAHDILDRAHGGRRPGRRDHGQRQRGATVPARGPGRRDHAAPGARVPDRAVPLSVTGSAHTAANTRSCVLRYVPEGTTALCEDREDADTLG